METTNNLNNKELSKISSKNIRKKLLKVKSTRELKSWG